MGVLSDLRRRLVIPKKNGRGQQKKQKTKKKLFAQMGKLQMVILLQGVYTYVYTLYIFSQLFHANLNSYYL